MTEMIFILGLLLQPMSQGYTEHYCDRFADLINTNAYSDFWKECDADPECKKVSHDLEACDY